MRVLRPLIPRCSDSKKQLSAPNSLLTIDESNRDIHGQRSTGRDLDRSETRIQHLPMGDIGGHTKIVLTVDMYGAGGPPTACDDNQFPPPRSRSRGIDGPSSHGESNRHPHCNQFQTYICLRLIVDEGACAPLSMCRQTADRKSARSLYYGHIHRARIHLNTCSLRAAGTPPTVA